MIHTTVTVSEGTNKELHCYEHAATTFSPIHRFREPQCTALQTDRRMTGWCQ